jgi:hypothetical protein
MKLKIGTALDGSPLYLSTRGGDFATHIHGIGKSQRGKSRLIAYIVRELIKAGEGLCLIDPHGTLYDMVVNWLAYTDPQLSEIILFNPSDTEKIVGFNPFWLDGAKTEERIMTKADSMVEATLHVWGLADTSNAPRLERWLRCLYYVLIEQDCSLEAARYFRGSQHEEIRNRLIQQTRSAFIKEEWEHLTTGRGLEAQLESTMNKLFKLLVHPTVRRVTGLTENSIDLADITDHKKVLLVNLQQSEALSMEAGRVIGTLLLNEVSQIMRRRKYRKDFFVIVDEFQNFATPDMPHILDELAKYGLHLILFHQRMSKLDTDLRGAMRNTDTKIIFGGVDRREVTELLERRYDEELIEQTISHPKRYFTLKRSAHPPIIGITPIVRKQYVREDIQREYVKKKLALYLTPQQVDTRLAERFAPKPSDIELKPMSSNNESPRTQIFNNVPEEISDDDLFE